MDVAVAVEEARGAVRSIDRRTRLIAAGVLGLVATITSAAIAAKGGGDHPELVAAARASMVSIPIGVGLATWYVGHDARFGLLLVGAGALWFVTTLAESSAPHPYAIGRLAGWFVEVLLVYLFLAYPSGRLSTRRDRLLVGAIVAVVAVCFLPQLLLVEHLAVPSAYTSCTHDCPANPFAIPGRTPWFAAHVLPAAGAWLTVAAMIAVVARLAGRLTNVTPLARRMYPPVLIVASLRAGLLGVGIGYRTVDRSAAVVEIAAWLLALALPAIALAFLAGLLRWQMFAERALARLATGLAGAPDPVTLCRALADSLLDPSLELALPARTGASAWIDARGRPLTLPEAGGGRVMTDVRDGGRVVAALVHDEALRSHPELLRAAASMAGTALNNLRLAAEAEAAMREVRRSRERIAASAALERRRIERDLHDGAQQRLVAIRIAMGLAEELLRRDPALAAARIQELEGEVDAALDELRELAHGVYPSLLADTGLCDAVRAAGARCTVSVSLDDHDVVRYPAEVESAVYFCIVEAFQNVLKHAPAANWIAVSLDGSEPGTLRFSVRDDGRPDRDGPVLAGVGITNMRDRLAAFGGSVSVRSTARVGTVVRGRVPTAAAAGR